MKFMVFLLLFGYPLVANAAPSASGFPILHPGGVGGIFKGPDSETIVQGPDGSVITSAQEGGSVVVPDGGLQGQPIVVAESNDVIAADPVLTNAVAIDNVAPQISGVVETGPIIAAEHAFAPAPVLSAAPVIAASPSPNIPSAPILDVAPVVAASPIASVPIATHVEEPHRIDIELVDAPEVESDLSATLIGPSGTITTRGSKSIVSGPASTTIHEPVRRLDIAPIATPIVQTQQIIASPPIAVATAAPAIATASVASLQPPIPVSTLAPPTNIDIGAISTLSSANAIDIGAGATLSGINIGAISSVAPPLNVDLSGLSVSSTLSPVTNNIEVGALSTLSPQFASTTASPISYSSTTAGSLDLNAAGIGIQNVQADPISSYGFINNANNLAQGQVVYSSSTEQPFISSTLAPVASDGSLPVPTAQALGGNVQSSTYLDQSAIDTSQLNINPSEIPLANIVPPEIGVQGARYLGATLSVSETPLASTNIQRIARIDNRVGIDGRLDSFNAPNDLLTGELFDANNVIGDGNLGGTDLVAPPLTYNGVEPEDIDIGRYPQAPGLGVSGRTEFSRGGPAAWNGYSTETRY